MSYTRKDVSDIMKDMFKKSKERTAKKEFGCSKHLDTVFNTTTWGFREVILTAVIGRLLDPQYKPSTKFYGCHPRTLYESYIRNVLLDYKIPNRKSGPLNVAKAAEGLNKSWAAQREPRAAADATVFIIEAIEKMSQNELYDFGISLHGRFLKEAEDASELNTQYNPMSDPIILFKIMKSMMDNATDAGNTPQKVVGLLMKSYFESVESKVSLTGWDDRASVTSTTSKKPGDIQEELPGKGVMKVYEVTMKPFTEERMRDSFDTLEKYASHSKALDEVIVICRGSDCPPEFKVSNDGTKCIGRHMYRGLTYIFYDIYEWTMNQLIRLNDHGRELFLSSFHEYVSHPNTSAKVKNKWRELNAKSGEMVISPEISWRL